jgi:hypothetical protein
VAALFFLQDEVLQIAERTGERWQAAELNRHKRQLLLRQGHTEAAEKLYYKALRIAGEQGAKVWELRAAVSFTRLRRDQGRPSETRNLLAPVYGWFTEGFDTADLKEALLDELAWAGDWHVPKSGTNVRSPVGLSIHGRGPGMALKGGLLSFAAARANDKVAPIPDLPVRTPERGGSTRSGHGDLAASCYWRRAG